MIRTLLASTALAALITTGAMAQDAATPAPADQAAPATEAPMAPADPATTAPADGAAPADAAAPADGAAPADAAAPAAGATTTNPTAGANVESGAPEETEIDEPWDMSAGYTAVDSDNLASELIDQPVYSSAGDDAEEIGNITDLVFSEGGQIEAVIIGVGGFLGIGEKSVAVDFSMLEFTLAADNTERWVLPTTADALTAAPDFVWEEDEPVDANGGAMAPADGTMAPADGAMAPADGGAMTPADPAMAPADPATAPAAPATN